MHKLIAQFLKLLYCPLLGIIRPLYRSVFIFRNRNDGLQTCSQDRIIPQPFVNASSLRPFVPIDLLFRIVHASLLILALTFNCTRSIPKS